MTAAAIFTPPKLEIPVFKFKIPKKDRKWEGDPTTFKIRQYTVSQELDALRVAKSGVQLEYELIQRTVVEIDGKAVDQGLNFLDAFSPPVRKRFQMALNHINAPDADEDEVFLKGEGTDV